MLKSKVGSGNSGQDLTRKIVFTILVMKEGDLLLRHVKPKRWAMRNRKEYFRMSQNIEDLEVQVMRLDIDGRARLAKKLLLSLDAPSEGENLHLWVIEAERRLKDLRAGKAKELSAEEAFRSARAAIL